MEVHSKHGESCSGRIEEGISHNVSGWDEAHITQLWYQFIYLRPVTCLPIQLLLLGHLLFFSQGVPGALPPDILVSRGLIIAYINQLVYETLHHRLHEQYGNFPEHLLHSHEICLKISSPLFLCKDMQILLNIDDWYWCIWNIIQSNIIYITSYVPLV